MFHLHQMLLTYVFMWQHTSTALLRLFLQDESILFKQSATSSYFIMEIVSFYPPYKGNWRYNMLGKLAERIYDIIDRYNMVGK